MKYTLAILVSLLVIVAGCATTPEADNKTVKKFQIPGEIKIGFIGPLTGDAAILGEPMKDTALLAVEEINEKGGINGRQVKLVVEDGKCEGKSAVSAAQKLINVDNVQFILGGTCSAETLAFAPLSEEAEVVTMSASSTSPKVKEAGEYIYRVVPSDAGQGKEGPAYLKEKGHKTVALLWRNDEWGQAFAGEGRKYLAQNGLELVADESFEPNAADLRTQLTKIKSAEPDAIYFLAFVTEAAVGLKQMKELGIDAFVLGGDASKDDALIESAGLAAEGFVVTLPGVPDSPEKKSYEAKYRAKFNEEAPFYTPEVYDAMQIAFDAFANSDGTGPELKKYLDTMGEFVGASGTFEFDELGEVEKPYEFFVVRGGEFRPMVELDVAPEETAEVEEETATTIGDAAVTETEEVVEETTETEAESEGKEVVVTPTA